MPTNCEIIRLPNDILRIVASYLRGTYGSATAFNYGREWKNLLNSNKSHFQPLKNVSQIIILNNAFTRLFLTSPAFRETVLSTVENRSKQLRFSLVDYSPTSELDLTPLCPAKSLSLRKCTAEIHSILLVGIEEITLFDCSIQDLGFCSQIGTVQIFFPDCESLMTPTLSSTTAFKVYCNQRSCNIDNYQRALLP
jgi:hypothetical protein